LQARDRKTAQTEAIQMKSNGDRQDGKRDGKSRLFENDDHTENGSMAARIKSPGIEG
jgi:hypothetical protein